MEQVEDRPGQGGGAVGRDGAERWAGGVREQQLDVLEQF
jgi:hypothetical protein